MSPLASLLQPADPQGGSKPQQLYQQLKQLILAGQIAQGQRLPPSRELANHWQCGRNTVIQAYEQLAQDGFTRGRIGAGTYVCLPEPDSLIAAQPEPQQITPVKGLSRRGQHLSAYNRSREPASLLLQPGIPELQLFPWDQWRQHLNRVQRRHPQRLAGYGQPQGLPRLRQCLSQYLQESRGVRCQSEQILITSGAQQGISMVAALLLDEGDPVWIEDPGYLGARYGFQAQGAQLCPVPVDEEGLQLNQGLAQHPLPKLIYTTPSHQYPSGAVLSLPRRLALLQLAQEQGSWILEDDYDSEYRYDRRPLAAMQGLDQHQRVLYLGTLSKVMFPGLRLGYLVLPDSLVEPFCRYRSLLDLHPPLHLQAALAEFIESGGFSSHIRQMRQLYQQRRDYFWQLAKQQLRPHQLGPLPDAGLHACLRLNGNDRMLVRQLEQAGLGVRALSDYCLQQRQNGLVMGYAGCNEQQLEQGVQILAQYLGRARA
ncbi:MocR-like pyridoxine biosynthesis transcription factor PdxR [Balneatrix alpica]|uniref:PLP-dependent aminotransferase family protein n=1 Tax=Balneatrix alpica TaxID=75684 RepID=A0ABV5ZIQ8_9GAMM|nr:PLP-dependent aminotransferase family protein [Balneatrix alpica]